MDNTSACCPGGHLFCGKMFKGNVTGHHSGHQEVGRCRTRVESEEYYAVTKAYKWGIQPGFETQTVFTNKKSKTGVSVAPQKGLKSSKILKK